MKRLLLYLLTVVSIVACSKSEPADNGSDNGGMAISADYKTFAIADSYTGSGRSGVSVQVYSVTWNGATPTFTHKYAIPLDGTKVVDQMEFDYAGNLVIASQQKGLLVYAIKNPARQTVPRCGHHTVQRYLQWCAYGWRRWKGSGQWTAHHRYPPGSPQR